MYALKRKWAGVNKSSTFTDDRSPSRSSSKTSKNNSRSSSLVRSSTTLNGHTYEDDAGLPSIELLGYKEETRHRICSPEIGNDIRSLMPTRIQLYSEWTLLYSLEQHGASLHTLYSCVKPTDSTNKRVGYVLIIQDMHGGIFGAYTNEYFHPTEKRRYYGNGECFLWKIEKHSKYNGHAIDGEEKTHQNQNIIQEDSNIFEGFPYTGINEFNIYATSEFLSFGAGSGHYGLWVDHDLLNGVSDRCLTYGNEELSKQGQKFQIKALEVWRVG